MKSKNWIRVVVLVALVAWPGYEGYRCHVARKQLAASIELRESMEAKLSTARVKFAQVNIRESQQQP